MGAVQEGCLEGMGSFALQNERTLATSTSLTVLFK